MSAVLTSFLLFASCTFARSLPEASTELAAAPVLAIRDKPLPGLPLGILGYLPNITINAVALGVYTAIAIAQTVLHTRYKTKYMLPMTVGVWCYAIGIVFRFVYRDDFNSIAIFIIMDFFVVLSPCAFIASVYSVLGQLATRYDAEDLVPIQAAKIAKVFIWSDVCTFCIQGNGSGLEIHENLATIGLWMFFAGLLLQTISFIFFTAIYLRFLVLARSSSPKAWANGSWGPLAAAMCVACTGITVRSFFRLIECAQGSHGFLTLHENYYMALDALPLAIAVGVFVLFWPERYMPERWDSQSAIPLNSINSDGTRSPLFRLNKERVAS